MNQHQLSYAQMAEMLAASQLNAEIWEKDCIALCESLAVSVTVEDSDSACDRALEKIAALKHIAIEVAAFGDCDCDCEKRPEEFCLYCTAVNVAKELKPTEGAGENEYMTRDGSHINKQNL